MALYQHVCCRLVLLRDGFTQAIIPAAEWDDFERAMRTPLPTSFRLSTISSIRPRLLKDLRTILQFDPVDIDGVTVRPPAYVLACGVCARGIVADASGCTLCSPLPWYPDNLAWSINCHKRLLRKNDALKKVQKWLVTHSDMGDVWRQEAVSMIPALMLDVKPHHFVLDLCAAPGSKTSQLVDMLHRSAGATPPTGVVVANEMNSKRAYMLTHRVRNPCAHLSPSLPLTLPIPVYPYHMSR